MWTPRQNVKDAPRQTGQVALGGRHWLPRLLFCGVVLAVLEVAILNRGWIAAHLLAKSIKTLALTYQHKPWQWNHTSTKCPRHKLGMLDFMALMVVVLILL